MCRCHGYTREPLRIQAFYIRLALGKKIPAPDKLTVIYLPRSSGASLELNDEWVLPGDLATAKLCRVTKAESGGDLVFGSTDKVCAQEGVLFEVYVGEEPAVKGRFRRHAASGWKMECWRAAEAAGIERADICVAGEDNIVMLESVDMEKRTGRRFCSSLEDIPEEREGQEEKEEDAQQMLGNPEADEEDEWDEEVWEGENEGNAWAVDLGIWAVCLGVGFLVSRASSSSSSSKRRRRFLPF